MLNFAKTSAEHLIGGKADGKPDTAFDPKALKKGRNVETEHTSSHDMAKEVAKDHLVEDPNYYEKLEKMEKKSMNYVKEAAARLKMAGGGKGYAALLKKAPRSKAFPAKPGDYVPPAGGTAPIATAKTPGAEKGSLFGKDYWNSTVDPSKTHRKPGSGDFLKERRSGETYERKK